MKVLAALLPVLIAFQAGAPPALAWTWPADGPVLRAFEYGENPYAAGQHRGIDVAGEEGAAVLAPTAGVVSFAGTVPGGGRTVTLQTPDGYSVTLVHLGSVGVAADAVVSEGVPVGTIGPSGEAEHAEPYVHMGVRIRSNGTGYLDPLSFLPTRGAEAPAAPAPPPDVAPTAPPGEVPEAPAPEPVREAPPPPVEAPVTVPKAPVSLPEAPAPIPETPAPSAEAPAPPPQTPVAVPQPSAATIDAPAVPTLPPPATADPRPNGLAAAAAPSRSSLPGGAPQAVSVSRGAGPTEGGPDREARPRSLMPQPQAKPSSPGGLFDLAPVVGAAGLLALLSTLALSRRQLARAISAHAPAPVLEDGASRAAEDAGAARPGEQDRLVLYRDFEGVAFGEPEPLPDLDGDNDSAQLVEVANDACRRVSATVSLPRFQRVRTRAVSRCRGAIVSVR